MIRGAGLLVNDQLIGKLWSLILCDLLILLVNHSGLIFLILLDHVSGLELGHQYVKGSPLLVQFSLLWRVKVCKLWERLTLHIVPELAEQG